MMSRDLARALDPALLAADCGIAPDPWQAELLRSDASRMLLLCARQTGKSTTTGLIGLNTALHKPGSLTLILSPSQRQSAEMQRTIMLMHARIEGAPALRAESVLRAEFSNGSRILALPGSERTVRGYAGVDLAILDEAARIPDELLSAVRPMLATSAGRLIMLSTPAGRRGFFFDAWHATDSNWHRVKVAAAACSRITPEFLAEELKELGPQRYSEEYELVFRDSDEAVFLSGVIDKAFRADIEPLWALILPCPPGQREIVAEKFVVGVDLGQAADPTAVAILHLKSVKHIRADGVVTSGGQSIAARYLQRLPLGLCYPEQAAEVGRLLRRPPLNVAGCELVLDATGVGRAVSDIFEYAGMPATQITITGGDKATCV